MISFDDFQPDPKPAVFGIRFSAASPAKNQLWHTWEGRTPIEALAGLVNDLTTVIPEALVRLASRHENNLLPVSVIPIAGDNVPENWEPGLRFVLECVQQVGTVHRFKIAARRVQP